MNASNDDLPGTYPDLRATRPAEASGFLPDLLDVTGVRPARRGKCTVELAGRHGELAATATPSAAALTKPRCKGDG